MLNEIFIVFILVHFGQVENGYKNFNLSDENKTSMKDGDGCFCWIFYDSST